MKRPALPAFPELPTFPAIPFFRLPPLAARIGKHLPAWPPAVAVTGALYLATAGRLLPADDIAALEGRRFRISVTDAGLSIGLVVQHGRFLPTTAAGLAPDLHISAPLAAYLQLLARQADPDTLFFERRLLLEGDTELGLQVKNLLDAVDFERLRALWPFATARGRATAS